MQVVEQITAPEREHRVYWWKEALIVAVFYAVYSWTRNLFGSNKIAADGIPDQAFTNAVRVIRAGDALNLFHEEAIQAWFLPYKWFIQFWNTWYGTMHFIVTLGVFILLFLKRRDVFPQWRNTLAAMTALAILGFAFFPLMPPRLLDEPCPANDPTSYGGACIYTSERPDGWLGLRRHARRVRRPVVVRLRGHGVDLEPVRGDAEHAHRVVDVVRRRRVAAPQAAVDEGARRSLYPIGHAVLHHRHRQPLLARRRRADCSRSVSGR